MDICLADGDGLTTLIELLFADPPGWRQLFGALEVRSGKDKVRLLLRQLGSRLGNLLRSRAVLQPRQDGGRVVPSRSGRPQIVLKITLIEAGDDLPGRYRIAFVH